MPNDLNGGTGRLRNVQDDPFAVRANRETTAGELLFSYDPTPGTWMYEWNNDKAEDAKFAANLGFTYRRLPTTTDAHIGFLANRQFFAFPQSAPAEDLWEINSRMVSKLNNDTGVIGNFYYGKGQSVRIVIKDSYSLCGLGLAKWGEAMKVPSEKEIMPYGLYTSKNVPVPLPIESPSATASLFTEEYSL